MCEREILIIHDDVIRSIKNNNPSIKQVLIQFKLLCEYIYISLDIKM